MNDAQSSPRTDYNFSWPGLGGGNAQAQGHSTAHIVPSRSPDQLAREAAAVWVHRLKSRQDRSVPYCVALSGGRITRDFFWEIVDVIKREAAVQQQQAALALAVGRQPAMLEAYNFLENVHFFWADERCVPPTDPESNFAMAQELLFGPLKIPDAQIHRLRGEAPEPLALKIAVGEICGLAPMSNGQPVLDLVFLGMGENGHVASLFPEETEEEKRNPAIYRAVTTTKPPPRRITLGYGAIAAAREVYVLVSGKGKEEALKKSLPPEVSTPLGRVMSLRKQTIIYTDVDYGIKR